MRKWYIRTYMHYIRYNIHSSTRKVKNIFITRRYFELIALTCCLNGSVLCYICKLLDTNTCMLQSNR